MGVIDPPSSFPALASASSARTALTKKLNSEMWGKGVFDIWEEWVVWVEKSKTPKKRIKF